MYVRSSQIKRASERATVSALQAWYAVVPEAKKCTWRKKRSKLPIGNWGIERTRSRYRRRRKREKKTSFCAKTRG